MCVCVCMYFVDEKITLNINCFNDNDCESVIGAQSIDFHDCCTGQLGFSYQNLTTNTCIICTGLKLPYVYNNSINK